MIGLQFVSQYIHGVSPMMSSTMPFPGVPAREEQVGEYNATLAKWRCGSSGSEPAVFWLTACDRWMYLSGKQRLQAVALKIPCRRRRAFFVVEFLPVGLIKTALRDL